MNLRSKLRDVARRVRNRLTPPPLVLMYHRVAELDRDPWSISVTPRRFAEQLEVLRERAPIVPLGSLAAAVLNGRPPASRAVAITFDDGYADNFTTAKPILERFDAPATVFLTTGRIGGCRGFWWDELEQIILGTGSLPASLELSSRDREHRWSLVARARSMPDSPERSEFHRSIYLLLRAMSDVDREAGIARLADWADAARTDRPTHRILTADEVARLSGDGLVEIGGHSVTHPLLSSLTPGEQRTEIDGCSARIRDIIGRDPAGFSYPHSDHSAVTRALVRQAGYAFACDGGHGRPISPGDEPFALPRFEVRDWDGDEFARRLDSCRAA